MIDNKNVSDGTFLDRLTKFTRISDELNKIGTKLGDIGDNYTIDLIDETCGFKLTQSISAWDIYTVKEIVEGHIKMKNDYIKRKNSQI